MITDPTRMCELLVGLPAVRVLGIVDEADGPLFVHIETTGGRPDCPGCGAGATVKDRDVVELVDLPAFGSPDPAGVAQAPLALPERVSDEVVDRARNRRIAAARCVMTARAGRWATDAGRPPRPHASSEMATDLGCDWHTVKDAVDRYGTAL